MGLHSSLMNGPTGTRNLRHLAAGVGWSCGVVPPPIKRPDSPLTDNSCWESLPPLQATVPLEEGDLELSRSEYLGVDAVPGIVSLTSDGASREQKMENLKWIWGGYRTLEQRN
ncbi:hypothetical protein Q8A67_022609 [Cirrhinus molitorella]|uniref:Uncharacterized protein n=1 Tax=Cirrhinus molitorella TaxID=172907 RepID=A0AA88P995_9TELE|nr:hypothetical protein Q8A67_022609 [Cirrhinus molitorella]